MEAALPFTRDEHFIGRRDILRRLNDKTVTILNGDAGSGKTHVVLEHAYRYQIERPNEYVAWLGSHGFWRLELSIRRHMQDVLVQRSKVDSLRAFLTWYASQGSQYEGSLLVLDDLSFDSFPELEKKTLVEFLNELDPKIGKIIVTTQMGQSNLIELGIDVSKVQLIQLHPFLEEEALAFLRTKVATISATAEEMHSITKSVNNLPEGLQVIGALWDQIIESDGKENAWPRLKGQLSERTAERALNNALRSVVDLIASYNDGSYRILCLMSVLDTQGVPLPLLYACWDTPHRTLGTRRALRRLKACSLVRCSNDGNQCFMSRHVRTCLQERLLKDGSWASYQRHAAETLNAMFKKVYKTTIWSTCEALTPHIKRVIAYDTKDRDYKVQCEALICKFARYVMPLSKYPEALAHYQRAEELCSELYGESDLHTLEVSEDVAYTLMMMDQPEKAAEIHKRIEKIYAEVFPAGHAKRLLHSGAYGAVLVEQGKWPEAEERLLKGVQGAYELYGGENRNGMAARNGLVRLYAQTGRYEEARAMCEENLALYVRDLPETHPNVFMMMGSLGTALSQLGRYQEALVQHRKAVELADRSNDATPTAVFEVHRGFAVTLSNAGQLVAASEEQTRLLALCAQIEPQPGYHSLNAHHNLGVTFERLSRYPEAQEHLERALQLCDDTAAADQTRLSVRNALALVYLRQGKNESAEKEYRDLVELQKTRHPDNPAHPDVLLMQNNLGGALQRQHRYDEAIAVQREVLERVLAQPNSQNARQAMFGRNNLAESLRLWAESGHPGCDAMLQEAVDLHRAALEQRERQLGEVWQTWISRVNIGMVLQAQGELAKAREWYTDFDRLEAAVGENNPTVTMVREKLANLDIAGDSG